MTLLGSSGAIALGLPYGYIPIYGALGPAEAEFYDLVLLREECPCTEGYRSYSVFPGNGGSPRKGLIARLGAGILCVDALAVTPNLRSVCRARLRDRRPPRLRISHILEVWNPSRHTASYWRFHPVRCSAWSSPWFSQPTVSAWLNPQRILLRDSRHNCTGVGSELDNSPKR